MSAELAAAVLMVECARIDGELAEKERDAICRAVREEFKLDEGAADSLVELAEMRQDKVWASCGLTEMVRTHFNENEQLALMQRLWEVASVDEIARPLEERLIARIAHNLDISDDAAAVLALYHRLRWPVRTGSGPELLIAARAG